MVLPKSSLRVEHRQRKGIEQSGGELSLTLVENDGWDGCPGQAQRFLAFEPLRDTFTPINTNLRQQISKPCAPALGSFSEIDGVYGGVGRLGDRR